MKKSALLLMFMVLIFGGLNQRLFAQDMALKTNLLYDATTTINLGYEVALNKRTTLDIGINYNPWTLGSKWVGLYENEVDGYASASERQSKLKHFMIQPEVRWWLCEKFNGHFFGVHLHGGMFNVGALKMPFDWGRYKHSDGAYKGEYLGTYPVKMSPVNNDNIKVNGIGYHRPSGAIANNDDIWRYADRDGIYVNSFEGWFIGAGVSYGYHWILGKRFSMEFSIGVGYAFLDYEKNRCTDCKKKIGDATTHYFGPTKAGISLVYMLK